jgi:hypothetical protein
MTGHLDMGSHDINNVDKAYIPRLYTNNLSSQENPGTSPIFANDNIDFQNGVGKTIINLPAPVNGGDAVNKTYVDTLGTSVDSYMQSMVPSMYGFVEGPDGTITEFTTQVPMFVRSVVVFYNGLMTVPGDDYTVGSDDGVLTVTFVEAPVAGSKVNVYGVEVKHLVDFQ